ncbi:CCR4-associated factor, partial [Musa troglodytarum]
RHGVSRPPLQHWEATPSTPAQPAVRPPQGQRRRDGARPTRPHPLRRLRPPPRHRHRRQGRVRGELLRLRLSHQGAGERHASARHPGRVPRPGELALRRDCGSQVHDVRLRGSLRRAGERGEYARCHAKLGSRIKLAQIAW